MKFFIRTGKRLLTGFCIGLLYFIVPVEASDQLVIDSSDRTIVTGTIVNMGVDSFVLRHPGGDLTVETTQLPIDDYFDLEKLFDNGMEVTVYGLMEDGNKLEATRIVMR